MKSWVLLVFFICYSGLALATDLDVAKSLLKRIAPQAVDHIDFMQVDGENDFFKLSSKNGNVVITGNNANSMAVGLNYYLKNYCLTNVSWFAADPIQLPKVLPMVDDVEVDAKCKNRFFLNYCTFGYTMPWWEWKDWERFIDWMALNGVTMPLAITGQEAIWHKVWMQLGLSDKEVRGYFTGPAHLPWHRMSNLDYWQGNLPMGWLEDQAALQQKILKREREFNMTPVLPAFAGHVPAELARYFPEAKISKLSSWGGFKDKYRSHFLDPMDPLFRKIQKLFLEEQQRLFGTNHIYGADPFNEVDPPSWDPEFLATVSKTIFSSITDVDPAAKWLQMSWIFHHDSKNWTKPRVEAFINGVPKTKMMLLDYYCEKTEIWKETESFYGQPYLWCYLGNFGGNTMMAGNLEEVGLRLDNVFSHGGANLSGVGATLEALDVNPYMYEFVFDKAWNLDMTYQDWVINLADRRLGRKDSSAREAWKLMIEHVYSKPAELGQGTLTNSRPSLEGNGTWVNPSIHYDNQQLFDIWKMMLSLSPSDRDSYHFDLVNIGRQFLGNYFGGLRNQFYQAYHSRNLDSLNLIGNKMIEVLNDLDSLLGTHNSFLLGNWINQSHKKATCKEEVEYYETNARTLLTTWGERHQSLNDYANRHWNGLVASYYKPRWEMFIREVIRSVNNHEETFDNSRILERIMDFEISWTQNYDSYSSKPIGDPIMTSKFLLKKYSK